MRSKSFIVFTLVLSTMFLLVSSTSVFAMARKAQKKLTSGELAKKLTSSPLGEGSRQHGSPLATVLVGSDRASLAAAAAELSQRPTKLLTDLKSIAESTDIYAVAAGLRPNEVRKLRNNAEALRAELSKSKAQAARRGRSSEPRLGTNSFRGAVRQPSPAPVRTERSLSPVRSQRSVDASVSSRASSSSRSPSPTPSVASSPGSTRLLEARQARSQSPTRQKADPKWSQEKRVEIAGFEAQLTDKRTPEAKAARRQARSASPERRRPLSPRVQANQARSASPDRLTVPSAGTSGTLSRRSSTDSQVSSASTSSTKSAESYVSDLSDKKARLKAARGRRVSSPVASPRHKSVADIKGWEEAQDQASAAMKSLRQKLNTQ